MSTATATVTVNAAFFHEIKDDNVRLRDLLEAARLANECCDVRRSERQSLARLLSDLRDQLGLHFSLEEAYGYFEDAVDAAPQLAQRAEALRREHHDLYAEACRLAAAAETQMNGQTTIQSYGRLLNWVRAFVDRIAAHERCENALIVEANGQDLGTGD
jgi:iron-sulfur cluster repair protein YtfE (RIC family)